MKKIKYGFLMVSLVLAGMTACSGSPQKNTVESSAYASPELAVTAYIEGLKEENLLKHFHSTLILNMKMSWNA